MTKATKFAFDDDELLPVLTEAFLKALRLPARNFPILEEDLEHALWDFRDTQPKRGHTGLVVLNQEKSWRKTSIVEIPSERVVREMKARASKLGVSLFDVISTITPKAFSDEDSVEPQVLGDTYFASNRLLLEQAKSLDEDPATFPVVLSVFAEYGTSVMCLGLLRRGQGHDKPSGVSFTDLMSELGTQK